jgi:hypothetical protein
MFKRTGVAWVVGIACLAAEAGDAAGQAKPPTTVTTKTITVSPAVGGSLTGKAVYDPARMATKLSYRGTTPMLTLSPTVQVALQPVNMPTAPVAPSLVVKAKTLPAALQAYAPHVTQTPYVLTQRPTLLPLAPATTSYRNRQTAIRNQGLRDTCTAFAGLAGMEVAYKTLWGKTYNLSEQQAVYAFKLAHGQSQGDELHVGLLETVPWLTSTNLCFESYWGYDPVHEDPTPMPPPDCWKNRSYALETTEIILAQADAGTSPLHANNTNYLEAILASGHEIVYAVEVAGSQWESGVAESGVIDVEMVGASPAPSIAGHAMLLVGYDRAANYFDFKNSWGTDRGHGGYVRLTYEYLQVYGKYGYYITAVAAH